MDNPGSFLPTNVYPPFCKSDTHRISPVRSGVNVICLIYTLIKASVVPDMNNTYNYLEFQYKYKFTERCFYLQN